MGAAAAEIAVKRLLDVAVGGLGILIEESFGGHDHPVDAVAALHGLLVNEGLLQWMHFLGRAQTFQSRHRVILRRVERRDA